MLVQAIHSHPKKTKARSVSNKFIRTNKRVPDNNGRSMLLTQVSSLELQLGASPVAPLGVVLHLKNKIQVNESILE